METAIRHTEALATEITKPSSNQAINDWIRLTLSKCGDHFAYLRERWEDEKEYENFADYVANASTMLAPHCDRFLGMGRRPFAAKFTKHGRTWMLVANSSSVRLKTV